MYRGIIDFKKGYQYRINRVKDEKGNFVADCHSILAKWRKNLSQLFNAHRPSDVRQTDKHAAVPLVPEPSALGSEMAVEKLKRHKSLGTDQISAELIKTGCRAILSVIHERTNSIWNKEELPEE